MTKKRITDTDLITLHNEFIVSFTHMNTPTVTVGLITTLGCYH